MRIIFAQAIFVDNKQQDITLVVIEEEARGFW